MAFEREIEGQSGFWMRPKKLGSKVARFRRVNQDFQAAHHEALELPNGQIMLLTRLCDGQFATVIQLPMAERQREEAEGKTTEVAATPVK
jgi:hypothetical protein